MELTPQDLLIIIAEQQVEIRVLRQQLAQARAELAAKAEPASE